MSDVREELGRVCLDTGYTVQNESAAKALVDAILERFDVTPKPVVDTYDLGIMVNNAFTASHNIASLGECMESQLAAKGLKIVRVSDE